MGAHFKALGCLRLNLSAGRLREPAPIMELMRAITLGVPALRELCLHGVLQCRQARLGLRLCQPSLLSLQDDAARSVREHRCWSGAG